MKDLIYGMLRDTGAGMFTLGAITVLIAGYGLGVSLHGLVTRERLANADDRKTQRILRLILARDWLTAIAMLLVAIGVGLILLRLPHTTWPLIPAAMLLLAAGILWLVVRLLTPSDWAETIDRLDGGKEKNQ